MKSWEKQEQKIKQGEARNKAWRALTTTEKLHELDRRPGASAKQRKKLNKESDK